MDGQTSKFLQIINKATNPKYDDAKFKDTGISFGDILGKYSADTGEKHHDLDERSSSLRILISSGLIEESANFSGRYKLTKKGMDYVNPQI